MTVVVTEELGVFPEDLTRELYTDAVAAARRTSGTGSGLGPGPGLGLGTNT